MISILIVLILLGLLLYIINLLPLDATIKKIIVAVAVVFIVIWIIGMLFPSAFGGYVFPLHR